MKEFLHNYSYSSIKMFVNQFAISLFGSMLAMATTAAKNNTLSIIVSILAILFYLFLVYTQSWELGAKDKISIDIGKKKYNPHMGLAVAAIANIPNLIIAILFTVASPFNATQEWAGNMCAVIGVITMFIEGMYLGVTTTLKVGGAQLNTLWWTYYVVIIPALLTAWLAYYLGLRNKKFTTLFDYQSPNKPKKK